MRENKYLRRTGIFFAFFFIILFFQLYKNIGYDQYHYDCGIYQKYGQEIFQGGTYNLRNLTSAFRGYIFPSLLGFAHFLDGKLGVGCVFLKIIFSILYGGFFAWSLPELMSYFFPSGTKTIYRKVAHLLLMSIFFWGLFIYPLTDLLGMILCIHSVLCVVDAASDFAKEKENRKPGFRLVKFFCAGIFAYAAYNVRSIYLFSELVVILLTVFICRKKIFRCLVGILAICMGSFVCSIPQIFVNYHLTGELSFMLPTSNLMFQQLVWGLQNQKYESYVGPVYGSAGLYFKDTAGMELISLWQGMGKTLDSFKDYIKLAIHYPLDLCGIYARHAVNMLLLIYPEQYIYDLEKNRSGLIVLNYLVIYVSGAWAYKRADDLKSGQIPINVEKILAAAACLLPSLGILPGALEQRFSVMLYLFIFGFLIYDVNYRTLLILIKKSKLKFGVSFILGFMLFLAIWSSALAGLESAPLIIGY